MEEAEPLFSWKLHLVCLTSSWQMGEYHCLGPSLQQHFFFFNLRELKENNSHTVSWWLFFILYSSMFSLYPLYCILFSCSLYISRQYRNYSVVTFCFPVDDSSEYRANSENISLTWLTMYIVQVRDRLSPESTYTPPFIRIDSPIDYMLLLASPHLLLPVPPHFTSYLDLLHFSLRKQTCF